MEKAGYAVSEELLELSIEGMTCASSVGRVEKALKAVPGVKHAEVNLATERAQVRFDAGVRPDRLVAAVVRAGYEAQVAIASDQHGEQLLPFAAAIQNGSEHPLAKAVMDAARAKGLIVPRATEVTAVAGRGMSATVKRSSQQAIAQLHSLGIQTVLITGDNKGSAEAVARALGIDQVRAEVLPEGKANIVVQLKAGGRHVAMVGDGLNDAPALAAANVGIAMSTGTDVAMHAAGITLMRGDPALIADAIDISRRTYAKIRQNLFWAFAYNVVGIPLAAFGLLNPMVAGAAMALSSVSVVTNALLLRSWKR